MWQVVDQFHDASFTNFKELVHGARRIKYDAQLFLFYGFKNSIQAHFQIFFHLCFIFLQYFKIILFEQRENYLYKLSKC